MKLATTLLVFCAAALLSLGLVVLFSSTIALGGSGTATMQMIWCGAGVMAAAFVACIDYRHWKKVSWLLLLLALGLLVGVLFAGETKYGATRWFRLHGFSFQPSELAKLAVVIALAHYGERYRHHMPRFVPGLFIPGMAVALVLGLIFLEPDWGTTLLIASVSGVMLLVAGVRWAHLLPILGTGTVGLVVVLLQNETRLRRILSWLNPDATKEGVGYQAYHAKLALASGGWTGVGLGNGAHYGYVPQLQNDFICAIIGEELGLACTLGLLLAFILFVICGIYIAWRARDAFGTLLATGITFLVGLQAFINIGVVTGTLPNKGLPLPFISRGGTNLFVVLVGVGLLLSIARVAGRVHAQRPTGDLADLEDLPSPQPC